MSTTYGTTTQLTTITCGECGGVYAISERYRQKKAETGGYWNCPYCKVGWGYGTSELDRLRKQKEAAEQRARWANESAAAASARAEREGRRAVAFKGHVTRIKNRVAKGECPCCQQTFEDLGQHMVSAHPDWAPDAEPQA